MNALSRIDKLDIKELLSKGWITHDAMWFYHSLEEVGIEKTNKINRAAVKSMATIEAMRIKKALGFQDKPFTSFVDLVDFMNGAMDIVAARFMHFKFISPEKNVVQWAFEKDNCFAYKGICRLGVIDQYECGVIHRIESWLHALQISFRIEPVVDKCIMHTKGECRGKLIFNLL
ncbi:MAG: hypothetical protein KJ737_02690 [Proteobacteria bacterium]|nr:hypothetical protein [Pseudomonadota bacterium]